MTRGSPAEWSKSFWYVNPRLLGVSLLLCPDLTRLAAQLDEGLRMGFRVFISATPCTSPQSYFHTQHVTQVRSLSVPIMSQRGL